MDTSSDARSRSLTETFTNLNMNMTMEDDVRWKQRFENFRKAFGQLKKAILETTDPSDLEKEGTIQRFEFSHELAWKVLKDYLEFEGISGITGSRSATRLAYERGLITNGQAWMDMIETRNNTVHTYMQEILEKEYQAIVSVYFPELSEFENKMLSLP